MRQVREIRYRRIAEELRERIVSGGLSAGSVLPSEAALAAEHAVSRVTVRKALDALRDDGLIDSRQGFGWFVAGDRLRQSLDTLATIEAQLRSQGRHPVRRATSFGFVPAPARVAALLGLASGDEAEEVLEVGRVSLADGTPFAAVTVWCPASLGASLSRADVEGSSFADLLPVRFGSATQTIGAAVADEHDAALLGVPVGSPLLVCDRVTRDVDGSPVLVAEHRYPAHLTEFVVELSGPSEPEQPPTGLKVRS